MRIKSIKRDRAEKLTTCPSCGAKPGEQCRARTKSREYNRQPHAARLALVNAYRGDPPLKEEKPEQPIDARRAKNTDDLFQHFADGRARAGAETSPVLREISIRSQRDNEWHTLFSVLLVEAMREIYDVERIAARLDELRAELRRSS